MIEDYPHAFPFPEKLLLGWCNGRSIHVVAAEDSGQQLVIVICQYGETELGTTTVALTRDDTTIVIRDVPALICTICGEEYVDAAMGRRPSEIAVKAVHEGVQVDVRRYQAA